MKYVVLLFVLVLLVGCGAKEVIVNKTTTNYATLDDSWIADCDTTPPPSPVPYAAADLQHRLDMWSKSYNDLVAAVMACNVRLLGARNYNTKKKVETTTVTCREGVCN